jgi:hypothetical protein
MILPTPRLYDKCMQESEKENFAERLLGDERFLTRLDALLEEAEASGEATEMTPQDGKDEPDPRREGCP